jgi:hypothetical protein
MRVRSSNWKIALMFTAAAVVWLGLSTTLFVLKLGDGMRFGCAFLVIGFFVFFGVLLAIWALSHVLRWLRFRDSYLEFDDDTRVGASFAGVLRFHHPFSPTGAMILNPRCIRHDVYRSRTAEQQPDRTSNVTVLWRSESMQELSEEQTRGPVAVSFPLPSGYPASTDPDLDSSIHWQLEVTVPARFVAFHSTFEIPVRGESNS